MTIESPPITTVDRIRSMMTRHGLNQPKTEKLLGVSHGTLGNWLTGTRNPNQVVTRLVAILEQVEIFYPVLFKSMITEASTREAP